MILTRTTQVVSKPKFRPLSEKKFRYRVKKESLRREREASFEIDSSLKTDFIQGRTWIFGDGTILLRDPIGILFDPKSL